MRILCLSYFIRHHQEYFEPMLLSLGNVHGVYLCHNALDQDYPGKSRDLQLRDDFLHMPFWAERPDRVLAIVEELQPDFIFWWNGAHPVYQELREDLAAWYDRPILFWELAWLPQSACIWADLEGVNALSSLATMDFETALSMPSFPHELKRRRQEYGEELGTQEQDYIFVPLQLEDDSNILRFSPYDSMEEFLLLLKKRFAGKRLVARPHPLDTRCYFVEGVEIRRDGRLVDEIVGARAVVGINSTVLVEALLFGKKVLALGDSILSGKGIVAESFDEFEEFHPDIDRIDAFLERLVGLEIDFRTVRWEELQRHPLIGRAFLPTP